MNKELMRLDAAWSVYKEWLADGDKSEIVTITFTLHERQLAAIKSAMAAVADECAETFGNTNKNGNALYEVVRQWQANR